MIRISKLTDYGLVLMAHMAALPSAAHFQAREIAKQTRISLPTVSKLLKLLTKHEFLSSERGAKGGYKLAKLPALITVADFITSLEGPIAITECNMNHAHCKTEKSCAIRAPWQRINKVITTALSGIKLSDLINFQDNSGNNNSGNNLKGKLNTHVLHIRTQ